MAKVNKLTCPREKLGKCYATAAAAVSQEIAWECWVGTCPLQVPTKSSIPAQSSQQSIPNALLFSHSAWDKLLSEAIVTLRSLSELKGGEYSGDDDRLANFRRNAEAVGCSMELVWRIYAGKHFDAISQYVKDLQTGKTRPRSEPIEGRVDDLIVYLLLFKAILQERNGGKQ